MKYMIDTYGRLLLSGVVVSLILALMLFGITDSEGNQGVLNIMGAKLGLSHDSFGAGIDFAAYQAESAKGVPSISYAYSGKLYADEDILITDFMKACDYRNRPLELRVLQIVDSALNDITSCYDKAQGKIRFPSEGISRMKLAARDFANKKYTCTIEVPVNRR